MGYTLPIYDMQGKGVEKVGLSQELFHDDLINQGLIHQYVVTYLGNQRHAIAHTKTRGEIRSSGRKLYRQKGTGRARVGDAASPIRRNGGTVFGPRSNANFSRAMPKKMKRKALLGALSLKARDGEILGLKEFNVDNEKTKEAFALLKSLNLEEKRKKVLVVLPEGDELIRRLFRNIPHVTVITADQINPYTLLTHRYVLLIGEAHSKLETYLLGN